MSKNVAVFVDVANIFYAAKAAGVDIDYVTLLKAATAGRDFVRAYAYTGLDPENDNQRQFHGFLARNGYKVISKDIRKYGDGRIKANLDIELVVDMMKTARNLDIAVVVSGDGDFASAIRAVQEMGVRVEVISFRGNTSSDLIEVADLFTDIAQIARVDKSGRSGRRVAAEGDLSMTEVPDKETEGLPRRRRGSRVTRDERSAAVERDDREERPAALDERPAAAERDERGGDLVVMPGERLSRAADAGPDADELIEEPVHAAGSSNGTGEGAADTDELTEEGRRRRRRRGGRGRGRGRRPEDEMVTGTTAEPSASDQDEEEEFEELPTAQPPVHTFGSVWDSQLGVPTSASMPPTVDLSGGDSDEDENYDEPEVPEYLLAERRQGGQRPGVGANRGRTGGRGGNRSAYQAALDRERFGSRSPQPSFGSSSSSGGNRSQGGGNRDRNRQGSRPSQQGGRPMDRGPRPQDRPMMESRPTSSSEPWSEVPPELEEMLRAELARKQPFPETPMTSSARTTEPKTDSVSQTAAEVQAKPARRTRTTKKPATQAPEPTAEASTAPAQAPAEAPAPAPAKRATRSRTTKAPAATAPAAKETAAPPADAGAAAAPAEAKKPTRRRTTKSTPPAAEEG